MANVALSKYYLIYMRVKKTIWTNKDGVSDVSGHRMKWQKSCNSTREQVDCGFNSDLIALEVKLEKY